MQEKFTNYYVHVACLIGVFPADYSFSGEDLLPFAIDSIVMMAEYLLPVEGREVPTVVLESFISRKVEKIQEKEITVYKQVEGTGNWIIDTFNRWTGRPIGKRTVEDGTHIDIGGKAAMRLACALGLTLKMLYTEEHFLNVSPEQLNQMMEANLEIAREKLRAANEYDEVDEILDKARSIKKTKKKKRKILKRADELYKEIRSAFD